MNLKNVFTQLQDKRVMVIGDIIVDEYVWGDVNRISPEAPVPVFEMTEEKTSCGGAANVAQNIVSLGGKAQLIGVIGKDRDGEKLVQMLNPIGVGTTDICMDVQRPTTKKTRVIVRSDTAGSSRQNVHIAENLSLQQGHHLLRIDRESKQEITAMLRERLLSAAISQIAESDAIIFSDYDKGVVSAELIKAVVTHAERYGIPVVVDPKRNNFWKYKGVTALTPNHKEAGMAVQEEITDVSHLITVGEKILDRLSLKTLLITREEEGMSLFQRNSDDTLQVEHLPSNSGKVTDVTGAGDTVVAVFALALAAQADYRTAAQLSSLAGGIVVNKMGCATVIPEELHQAIDALPKI
ncbi:MAG: PfkB family carbohydrate kinase [Candidatus Poribacteria bacterium]|nr:PfkB family carbohydrate kinase [Candidatus Poribacteria bacterium]